MSIENLKKLLESDKEEYIKKFDNSWIHFDNLRRNDYLTGRESVTNRILPFLQKAVEMAELISCKSIYVGENGWQDEHFLNVKQAEEFLAEFTKMTEIKKEGE